MIVPMKKVTLLALEAEQTSALTALRNLGVMQVEIIKGTPSDVCTARIDEAAAAAKVYNTLKKLKDECKNCSAAPAVSGAEAIERGASLLASKEQTMSELDSVRQRLNHLLPWGEFNRNTILELEQQGVYVKLCSGSPDDVKKAEALPEAKVEIMDTGARIHFVVISTAKIEPGVLPEVILGENDNPAELNQKRRKLELKLQEIHSEITDLFGSLDHAKHYVDVLHGEMEYALVRDSLTSHGAIVSIRGYVPEYDVDHLRAAAKSHGWGLWINDPSPEDRVPTLLKTSKWIKIVAPLFQFLGIAPGYDELDASGAILIFFTIFYAMIVGDAGYGLIFLLISFFLAWKSRSNINFKMPAMLMGVLSVATIGWGLLTGNVFGTSIFPGIDFFTNPAVKDANTQAFCFVLAIAQLSLGRIWKALHDRNLRSIIRNLGWMLILWGNFFLTLRLIVYPGQFPDYMYYLYGVGLLGVIACDVDWKNPADIFQFPFNIIGSFVDMLSYIRLFAVGMAGYYIAVSFNSMAEQLSNLFPFAIIFGILVILAGHGLNLALCVMGVLVHGVRLNTLEFSNHIGLRWGGSNFKPFKNIKHNKE